MNKKRKIIIFVLSLIAVIAGSIIVYFNLFKIKADMPTAPATYITSQASVSYQDTAGGLYSKNSNVLKIREITLFKILAVLQGREAKMNGAKGNLTFVDTNVVPNQSIGR